MQAVLLILGVLFGGWTDVSQFNNIIFNKIIWGGKQFIAIAPATSGGKGKSTTHISVSQSGVIWKDTVINDYINDIHYFDSIYVAVGAGAIYKSIDGNIWLPIFYAANSEIQSIASLNGAYILTVDSINASHYVLISKDMKNWDRHPFVQYASMLCSNEQIIICRIGGAEILSSSNGIDWTMENTPLDSSGANYSVIRSIKYANNFFWGVGDLGLTMASSDGTNWKVQKTGNFYFQDIAWGNGLYVSAADSVHDAVGLILQSPDGITWTQVELPNRYFYGFNGVAYGNGVFVVVGGDGRILINSDASSIITRKNNLLPRQKRPVDLLGRQIKNDANTLRLINRGGEVIIND